MGIEVSEDDLMGHYAEVGRCLEAAFNSLHTDLGRQDDLPPRRFREEAVRSGPYRGSTAAEDEYMKMLDEYYELSGWDPTTGRPTLEHLERIGLWDVAEWLRVAGRT